MKRALCILCLLAGLLRADAAGDRIWSALVLATREDPARPAPEALEKFSPAIARVFGYNSLYLLGEKKRDLASGGEAWLVPTKEFFFRVQCLAQEPTFYQVRLELYQDKTLLVTTDVRLAKDAPLYIRGPQWGRGQLIFVLDVR